MTKQMWKGKLLTFWESGWSDYGNFFVLIQLFVSPGLLKKKYHTSPLGPGSSGLFFQELIKCHFVPAKRQLQLHHGDYSVHFPSPTVTLPAAGCLSALALSQAGDTPGGLPCVYGQLWFAWGWELQQCWLRKLSTHISALWRWGVIPGCWAGRGTLLPSRKTWT